MERQWSGMHKSQQCRESADSRPQGACGGEKSGSRANRSNGHGGMKTQMHTYAYARLAGGLTHTDACASRSVTMEDWPRRRAMVRGVSPSLSAASLLAPASSSSRATASWPLDAAQWRGVQPLLFAASLPAPASSSSRATASWPFSAAKCRAVARTACTGRLGPQSVGALAPTQSGAAAHRRHMRRTRPTRPTHHTPATRASMATDATASATGRWQSWHAAELAGTAVARLARTFVWLTSALVASS